MAKRSKQTIGELQDEIERRDERIKELRQLITDQDQEHDRLRNLDQRRPGRAAGRAR